MPQIQIQIINIGKETKMTKGGKPYDVIEATYKNLTFQGKIESKKIMPFGETGPAAKVLASAQNGDVYDIVWQKSPDGQYNNWISATSGQAGSVAPSAAQAAANNVGVQAPAPARGGWETPDERAKRQVFIIRQSSLSTAVEALTPGAKAPLDVEAVISYAKKLEAYVFTTGEVAQDNSGFDDMMDDVPN